MRISDWSSDVCSSYLAMAALEQAQQQVGATRQALQQARSRMALQRRFLAHQQARWHAGAIDHRSAVLAQLDALQTQREWLAAVRAHVAALGALEAAVQRPLWPASTLDRKSTRLNSSH